MNILHTMYSYIRIYEYSMNLFTKILIGVWRAKIKLPAA